jgi:AcrR family transcriptional regulator
MNMNSRSQTAVERPRRRPGAPRRRPRFASKQEQLLVAARGIVSAGGFHDLRMLTVAAAARVSVGSVYRYHRSKAELCAALVARVSSRELEVIEEALARGGPPASRLAAAVTAFARRALESPRLAYAMLAEPVDEAVDRVRLEYRAAITRAFERLIEQAVEARAFARVPVRTAAACVVGAFLEALVGPLAPGRLRRADQAAFIDDVARMCLAIVGPRRRPRARRRRRSR